jgi:hypothetical protein
MVTTVKNDQIPEFAGDYVLKEVLITNHAGDKVNVKNIMTELNIYESIFKSAVTGSLVLTDATNQIARMQLQGLERVSFHLKTPGVAYGREDVVDATEETGEPFYIYKISDRKQATPGLVHYTLHFASREFMRNMRTKVSQAYDGKYDRAVIDIMKDKSYLDSRKKLHYEPTGNANKIVIPNLPPLDAINMIAKRSISDKSNNVGYYFYETTTGYYFRSWASMITSQGNFTRPQRQDFYYQPLKMNDHSNATNQSQVERGYESVEEYQFVNNFHDVVANTTLGTYGHRVISHNLFDKSYDINDYHYHNEYNKTPHTDGNDKYPVMDSTVDYDKKKISDYAESRVSLQVTTPFLHDKEVGNYGLEPLQDSLKTGQQVSQGNQVMLGTALKLTVKGQSYLQPGNLIRFHLKDVNADNNSNDNPVDPYYSGNYVITKIRHIVHLEDYKMILECAKDSVATSYGSASQEIHTASKPSLEIEEIDGDINY